MKKNRFPPGWDEARVQKLLKEYEEQSEAEALAEDEASFERTDQTFIQVPNELVPEVRRLVADHMAK